MFGGIDEHNACSVAKGGDAVRIDFLGLHAFVAVAERGGFQRAALHLGLSQTALSHRMRKLEDDLGIKLLVRTTREVTLTEAGLELLPEVKRSMAALSQSVMSLTSRGSDYDSCIAVGCLPTIASTHMPAILDSFRKQHPQIVVQIYDHSATDINELLAEGKIVFGINMVTTQRWNFDVEPLTKDAFCLVCPTGHPLAKREWLNWSDLADHALVRISQQTGNRILMDDVLGSRRETLRWMYEVQHLQTALAIVRQGIALSVLPRMAVEGGDDRGVVCVPLKDPTVTRQIGIVTKRGIALSPIAAALRRDVIAVIRNRSGVPPTRLRKGQERPPGEG